MGPGRVRELRGLDRLRGSTLAASLARRGAGRLEGAYEKTTNGWLLRTGTKWELVTSEFLHDFELEDPDVPGTKNVTGTKSVVRTFKKGKFEFVSNQLPPKRTFAIKR